MDNLLKLTLKMTKFLNTEEDWMNLRSPCFYSLNFEQLSILVNEVTKTRKPHGTIRVSKSENAT